MANYKIIIIIIIFCLFTILFFKQLRLFIFLFYINLINQLFLNIFIKLNKTLINNKIIIN